MCLINIINHSLQIIYNYDFPSSHVVLEYGKWFKLK